MRRRMSDPAARRLPVQHSRKGRRRMARAKGRDVILELMESVAELEAIGAEQTERFEALEGLVAAMATQMTAMTAQMSTLTTQMNALATQTHTLTQGARSSQNQ